MLLAILLWKFKFLINKIKKKQLCDSNKDYTQDSVVWSTPKIRLICPLSHLVVNIVVYIEIAKKKLGLLLYLSLENNIAPQCLRYKLCIESGHL